MTILKDHITHESGEKKTVCVTACLTHFGVDVDSFHYTGFIGDGRRAAILRRNGYHVRSRMSRVGKGRTIAAARKRIAKLDDSPTTQYLICVRGRGWAHAMVLDGNGATVVDTDPRKSDRRKVVEIFAVYKPQN